jgi:hypothetical protein
LRRPWTPVLCKLQGKRVCKIPLSQGLFALIDAKHLTKVECYSWCARRHRNTYYAATHIRLRDGTYRILKLHKLIWRLLGKSDGPVDHKNNNGLDCRSANLRPGPVLLNGANRLKQTYQTSSQYKGVSWDERRGKWRTTIRISGKLKHLGYFNRAEEEVAALAYDRAALKAWGKYANLNFPRRN